MFINDHKCLFDLDDYNLIKQYMWSISNNGYVVTGNKKIRLARLIMKPNDGLVVDHINGNKLDNRKANLRICTLNENNKNHTIFKTNRSGTTGVYYDKSTKSWSAQIYDNGNPLRLGRFKNKEEAIKVRKRAEEIFFGEFARK